MKGRLECYGTALQSRSRFRPSGHVARPADGSGVGSEKQPEAHHHYQAYAAIAKTIASISLRVVASASSNFPGRHDKVRCARVWRTTGTSP